MIRKCPKCGKYTLRESCPVCGKESQDPRPARFSPEDKYVRYRLEWRMKDEGSNN